MASVNVKKRGKVYQYRFEVGKVNGKRKRISKSGFKTKLEAEKTGTKAYNEFLNTGLVFKEENISYSDYLDYWLNNYCKTNLRYNTIQAYTTIVNKYLKPNLGIYRLSSLTSVKLNSFIVELCNKYKFSGAYFSNLLKVLKGSFREACDVYGFIKYNPTLTLRLPKVKFYNLDMIISLGYRIKSKVATNFRKWATERLKEYMIKGFTMDDERLKGNGGGNYWKELYDIIFYRRESINWCRKYQS